MNVQLRGQTARPSSPAVSKDEIRQFMHAVAVYYDKGLVNRSTLRNVAAHALAHEIVIDFEQKSERINQHMYRRLTDGVSSER